MPSMTVYGIVWSPPVRATLVTAKILNIPFDFKQVNTISGDQFKPEYLKINPLHTIPSIDDDGYILFDSHAIMIYLFTKYGTEENQHLYPEDPKVRGIINQRMFFNISYTFIKLREAALTQVGGKELTEEMISSTDEVLNQMELLLGDNDWIAHTPKYSIADIACLCTSVTLKAAVPGLLDRHPKLMAYIQRGMEQIPYYEEHTIAALKYLNALFGREKEE